MGNTTKHVSLRIALHVVIIVYQRGGWVGRVIPIPVYLKLNPSGTIPPPQHMEPRIPQKCVMGSESNLSSDGGVMGSKFSVNLKPTFRLGIEFKV